MQKIPGETRRALHRYNMIETGERAAAGVLGGKESLVLLCTLARLRRGAEKRPAGRRKPLPGGGSDRAQPRQRPAAPA